jgi:hypothetical protein
MASGLFLVRITSQKKAARTRPAAFFSPENGELKLLTLDILLGPKARGAWI